MICVFIHNSLQKEKISTQKHHRLDRGITAENMEKSKHADFNKDTTCESASMTCSNIWLLKLDIQKE